MARKNQEKKYEDLSEVVKKEMIGKYQIPGTLKRGENFCISGLLINHFAPDIDIEGQAWSGITELVNRYPKYFSEESYNRYPYDGTVQGHIESFKEYYKSTGQINFRILVSINDESISRGIPFTFSMFADLFSEIGIKIEQLEPVTNYKENDLISINTDNIQVIDNSPKIEHTTPFGNMHVDVHLELDPEISKLLSQHISNMLFSQKEKTKPQWNMLYNEKERAKHPRWTIETEQK
jgi:hypothetical protein